MGSVARLLIPVLGLSLLLPLATLSAKEPAKATGTIAGKVVHEDGSVAAGMEVRVVVPPPRRERAEPKVREPEAEKGPKGARTEPVATVKTSADGTFSVSVPVGEYVVMSGKRGEGMGRERVTVTEGKTVNVSLTLKKLAPGGEGGGGGGGGGKKKPGV